MSATTALISGVANLTRRSSSGNGPPGGGSLLGSNTRTSEPSGAETAAGDPWALAFFMAIYLDVRFMRL